MLTRKGQFDEALATIDRIQVETQKGVWRHSTLLALGDTLSAAGKKDDALKAYRSVVDDETASKAHREAAAKALEGES